MFRFRSYAFLHILSWNLPRRCRYMPKPKQIYGRLFNNFEIFIFEHKHPHASTNAYRQPYLSNLKRTSNIVQTCLFHHTVLFEYLHYVLYCTTNSLGSIARNNYATMVSRYLKVIKCWWNRGAPVLRGHVLASRLTLFSTGKSVVKTVAGKIPKDPKTRGNETHLTILSFQNPVHILCHYLVYNRYSNSL